MDENANVCWMETSQSWLVEEQFITAVGLPLNLDKNRNHSFYKQLTEIRAAAQRRADELPVWRDDKDSQEYLKS
jgi:hypothetical protein